ncbi:MFS transporter [Prosthecomicrobium hirschii]|uniref:MFS transporter n=1 Tax=Prosthecodimorpha hirschii TaxID=665126 RepID=UPI002220D6B7|nr:MFS transporter [Prosthecomicrobium hirschii]MCW1840743.1 MFS transporter [Prosthecomicrobium hirschii]
MIGLLAGPVAAPASLLILVNFLLADVRDGLGPFLGIFLIEKGWTPDKIGLVMSVGGFAGMIATTPLGILADATKAKRAVVVVCAVLVTAASLAMLLLPSFAIVTSAQVATGIAGAAIAPAIASLTLGIVGQTGLAHQLGRNEAANHAGNVLAAVLAGVFGAAYGLTAVFVLMGGMAIGSIVATLAIPPGSIDHAVARGLEPNPAGETGEPPRLGVLLQSRPLALLAVTLALFHLGNAALLPLLGQQAASRDMGMDAATYTAATIVIAQLTMVPMALGAARMAERHGYWLVLACALFALPIRALLAGIWVDPWAVLPVQMLDGVGAGLLGVAVPGLVARILRGTGHVNAGLGLVMTVQGIGAALSPAVAGAIATRYGFPAAFLTLGVFALIGLALWAAGRSFSGLRAEGVA